MYIAIKKITGIQGKAIKWLLFTAWLMTVQLTGAQNLNNPNKVGPLGTQVNTFTGNLFIPRTDLSIPARGLPINIRFYYNSYNFFLDEGFGKGWSFRYNIRYRNDTLPGRKRLVWGDGREDIYDSLPDGTYKTPRGFFSKLEQYSTGKFKLTEPGGTVYFFDNIAHKKVTLIQDPNGNKIQFTYTENRLSSLANDAGQAISFAYDGAGRLAAIVDAIASPQRTFSYKYDGAGNLVEVIDPLEGKYKYSYLVNGPMKTLTDKNSNTVNIIYFPDMSARELIGCNKRLSFSYDTATRKTVVTDYLDDGNNQVTTYSYQKMDRLAWLTAVEGNCCGFNMRYEYDEQGNKQKETDANGNAYQYTYDDKGNILTVTDPHGGQGSYTYSDSYNRITSYADPAGNRYLIDYDNKGNLVGMTTPSNDRFTASYNEKGDIVSITDLNGARFTYHYDTYGNPTHMMGPNGYKAALSFDARGNLLSILDANGNAHTAEYDILNRLKKIIDPNARAIQYSYDAMNNPVSFTNKNGETSLLNYDAANRLVKLTTPTGSKTEVSHNALDKITMIKDAMGQPIRFGYDKRGRLNRITDPLGNAANMEYDTKGNVTAVRLPTGRTLSYAYNKMDRLTKISDASGELANFTYDANGNLTSYKNGTGAVTTASYDNMNRLTKLTDPLGNATHYAYDKSNNPVTITDRNGFSRHYTYDSLNRVKTFTDNNGFVITAHYDAIGNVTELIDQNGNSTTYTYDQLNRRKTMRFSDGTFQQYTYDGEGNLIAKRLTDGTSITYTYDTLDRMIAKTLPGGEVHRFSYDVLGRVVSATNNNGTVHLTYDALGRIASETFEGRTVSYQYNIGGRSQTTVYPDGTSVVKEYDTRNRLQKISKDSVVLVEYSYNNADQITQKQYANGVNTIFQYDMANRLNNFITSGNIQQTVFAYDKEGNKTAINRINRPGLSETFTYDKGYRLLNYNKGTIGDPAFLQQRFTYDAVGNRIAATFNGTSNSYTVNQLNQVTAQNGTNYSFDDRGNLVFDGQFYKLYDAEGRLLKDSSSSASVLSYAYDAFGRRVRKTINGVPFTYTYSGEAQIEERDGNNTLLNKTIFTNFRSPVANEKAGSRFFYHPNELNSVEAITTDDGRLLESYQYDAFGKPTRYDSLQNVLPSSLSGNRFGFTGQEWDSATGSYRFFYRNYRPETGVFNQRDLIEYKDGMGMYQYVHNNPANGVDIFGLATGPDGKPCYDKDEYLFITNEEWNEEVKRMRERLKREKFLTPDDFIKFDSKFYLDLKNSIHWQHHFYIGGQPLRGDQANYYFQGMIFHEAGLSKTTMNNTIKAWRAADFDTPSPETMEMADRGYNESDDTFMGKTIGESSLPETDFVGPIDLQTHNVTGGVWRPVYNTRTKQFSQQFFKNKDYVRGTEMFARWDVSFSLWKDFLADGLRFDDNEFWPDCPPEGGTLNIPQMVYDFASWLLLMWPIDPNEIIGPEGVSEKKWVSVKDRMQYTIRCENDTAATAPARYIRFSTPIHLKHDATTFELGGFGFNNQNFEVPQGLSSYYQRLDWRDSIGLYVDVVAGYDQMANEAFWEFRGIDPVTLLPSDDPEKGILFLQDTAQPLYGHGYVTFSIKPKSSAATLDTTAASASIVFDENEAIETNVWVNTIDAVAPQSRITAANFTASGLLNLEWTGQDDAGGSGVKHYNLYVSTDGVNYSLLASEIKRTDTTFLLQGKANCCFFVLATDSVNNQEILNNANIVCASGGVTLPVSWLTFSGKNVARDNLLEWSTASEQNSKEFKVQRSLNGINFTNIGTVAAAGNSSTTRNYSYVDRSIDKLNSGVMYYRVQQVDRDGKATVSNVVRLTYQDGNRQPSIVYPNPTKGTITVTIGDRTLLNTNASLFDQSGKLLQTVKITAGSQPFDLSRYTNGTYYIRLSNKEVLKIIKQ